MVWLKVANLVDYNLDVFPMQNAFISVMNKQVFLVESVKCASVHRFVIKAVKTAQ